MLVIQNEANIFDGMFSLMAKSDDENDEDGVTLLDIKKNLYTLFVRRLRKLANIFIDFVKELTTEKDSMNSSLDSLSEEKVMMIVQMSVIEEQLVVLKSEN